MVFESESAVGIIPARDAVMIFLEDDQIKIDFCVLNCL
jgi:hypothetical protein